MQRRGEAPEQWLCQWPGVCPRRAPLAGERERSSYEPLEGAGSRGGLPRRQCGKACTKREHVIVGACERCAEHACDIWSAAAVRPMGCLIRRVTRRELTARPCLKGLRWQGLRRARAASDDVLVPARVSVQACSMIEPRPATGEGGERRRVRVCPCRHFTRVREESFIAKIVRSQDR